MIWLPLYVRTLLPLSHARASHHLVQIPSLLFLLRANSPQYHAPESGLAVSRGLKSHGISLRLKCLCVRREREKKRPTLFAKFLAAG